MKLKATIEHFVSRRDINGNCYHGFRFTDHEDGRSVEGTICGGESNINAIRFGFSTPGEWDRSILYHSTLLGIREFSKLTKDWRHAGCSPKELQAFIWKELSKKEGEVCQK